MGKMNLYHTGFEIIKNPDVHMGRANADFGQGFYLTADEEFAHRWARVRKDRQTIVNAYVLDTSDLVVYNFTRNEEWFKYIFNNRGGYPDKLEADVVIGPIANDTIYDTYGVITSGVLEPHEAMRLLMIGPEYHQIALKTDKAAGNLEWVSSVELSEKEVEGYRYIVAKEEEEYQEIFGEELDKIT